MTGAASFPIVSAAGAALSRADALRVKKIFSTSGLQQGGADPKNHKHEDQSAPRAIRASQNGTKSAPSWYAQRLSSGFVAQILGQVLTAPAPDLLTGHTAYRETRVRAGAAGLDFTA